MSGTRTRLIAATLAVVALAVAGCSPQLPSPGTTSTTTSSQVATPQTSVEPTTPVTIVASGPITTPVTGSAERTALLNAARSTLGITSEFYVYQLFVQGDTALGDIEPVSKSANGRIFVAWERRSGAWTAIAASKFGAPSAKINDRNLQLPKPSANAADTARALPSFSTELIGKIDWTLKKVPPSTSTTTKLSATKLKDDLATSAKQWAKQIMTGTGSPYTVPIVKVAADAKGVWWGVAVVQPTGSFERIQFWAKYSGGKWSGKAQDPEPPAPSTYFPASVISKLGL